MGAELTVQIPESLVILRILCQFAVGRAPMAMVRGFRLSNNGDLVAVMAMTVIVVAVL